MRAVTQVSGYAERTPALSKAVSGKLPLSMTIPEEVNGGYIFAQVGVSSAIFYFKNFNTGEKVLIWGDSSIYSYSTTKRTFSASGYSSANCDLILMEE